MGPIKTFGLVNKYHSIVEYHISFRASIPEITNGVTMTSTDLSNLFLLEGTEIAADLSQEKF